MPKSKSKLGPKEKNPIEGLDGQLMVMAAHRYCLGRRSYIVGAGIDWLALNWNMFEPNTQNVILRDTYSAVFQDEAGSDFDRRAWEAFFSYHYNKLTPEQQLMVRNSIPYWNQKYNPDISCNIFEE